MTRRTRRRLLLLAVLVFAAAVAVLVFDALRAYRAFSALRADGAALSTAVRGGDLTAARAASLRLRGDSARAHAATDDPVWAGAGWVPFVGDEFSALAAAGRVADVMARTGVPTVLDLQDAVTAGRLKPVHGRLDPAAVASFTPQVDAAATALDGPAAEIADVDAGSLLPPLRGGMIEFKKQVASARQAVDAARSAFQVAPMMLGAGGPRDYLVLVQNPAELRSTGGLPGNWTLIHADNGTLTIRASDTSALLAVEHPADLTLSADETALFGAGLGVDARDINVDPDFPRVAQIAASKYLAATGVSVSAVFAMDPQALAYVLEGTGPIAVTPSQGIDPGNVVKTLTNTIYMTLPKPAADAFNTAAAHAVFSALVTGQGDELKAIRGLVTAASQQRVLAWSPVPEIARAIGTGSLAGALPGDTGRTPQVGVYLNDAVQGKPDYYLDQSSAARSLSCVNGVQRIEVTTTLRSTMPGNAAHLPPLVVGDGHVVPPGTIALGLYVVAPWDGAIESVEVGGTRFVASAMLNGRPVAPVYLTLQPGEEATITSVVRSAKGQTGDGRLAWTPGVSPTPGPVRFASRC